MASSRFNAVSRRVLILFPWSRTHFVVVRWGKKKKGGTPHASCKCYAASSSAMAVPVLRSSVRDGLRPAVSAFGRFFA